MTANRIGMVLLWVLALILPGGFILMGLWLSIRAARGKRMLPGVAAQAVARVSTLPAQPARISVVGL